MSTPAEAAGAPTGAAETPGLIRSERFRNCWSCRVLCGGGLVLSGAYVFNAARKVMRHGGPTSMGTVAQITFAACLFSWGVIIITDPVGKATRKT